MKITTKQVISDLMYITWHNEDVTREFIADILQYIQSELARWNEVELSWFGKFWVTPREARKWINPSTWEEMIIPECKTPKFTAGKQLKDFINKRD